MDLADWRYTLVGAIHDSIARHLQTQSGELPVVSCLISDESWYLFTTRRIMGKYMGTEVQVVPAEVVEDRYGDNPKNFGKPGTDVMTLKLINATEANLAYETGKALMAPIYYMKFWKTKVPVLDKLVG